MIMCPLGQYCLNLDNEFICRPKNLINVLCILNLDRGSTGFLAKWSQK